MHNLFNSDKKRIEITGERGKKLIQKSYPTD